jgi:hypothetical protein
MSKEFVWTDELVKAFKKSPLHDCWTVDVAMKFFKQHQQPIEDKKEDCEIMEFKTPFLGFDHVVFKRGADGMYSDADGHRYDGKFLLEKNSRIHSVKRLPDNEVFSLGDNIGGDFTIDKIAYDFKYPLPNDITLHSKDRIVFLKYAKTPKPNPSSIEEDYMEIGGIRWSASKGYHEPPKNEYKKESFYGLGVDAVAPYPFKHESIKEPEKIEAMGFYESGGFVSSEYGGSRRSYTFHTKESIQKEKYPLIKQAIEQVLNDDNLFDLLASITDKYQDEKLKYQMLERKVDKLQEDAFNAGRALEVPCKNGLSFHHFIYEHQTFQDYKNSMNKNNQ